MRTSIPHTPLLVREPEKQFTEMGHYSESKRILDIMVALGVKRGPFSGNGGPIQILSSTVRVSLLPLRFSLLVGSLKRKASTGARAHTIK